MVKKKITYRHFGIFIILKLLMISQNLHSQSNIGFKAGLNVAGVHSYSFDGEVNTRVLPHFGLFYQIKSDNIYAQLELCYSAKGYKYIHESEEQGNVITVNGEFSYNYIDIPLHVGFYLSDNFSVFLGPQFDLIYCGSYEMYADINGQKYYDSGDFDDKINMDKFRNSMSFNLGARYHSRLFGVGIAFSHGIVSVKSGYNDRFYNKMIQISLFVNLFKNNSE